MLTMIRANIKRQRGSFVGIFILIFIITISICSVETIWKNSNDYESKQIDNIGYGDVTSWTFDCKDIKKLCDQIEAVEGVEKVETRKLISTDYTIHDKKSTSQAEIISYNKENGFQKFNNSLNKIEGLIHSIPDGTCYVAPSFCSLYGASIGDEISYNIDTEHDYKMRISGYYEDPMGGSSMMGIKNVLVNERDYQNIVKLLPNKRKSRCACEGYLVHMFKDKNSNISIAQLQNRITENTDLSKYVSNTYSRSTIIGFMLLLQNIFSGFLLLFVVVLVFVAIIVLSHSISTGIEEDYVNMGVLKAVGYNGSALRRVQMFQYLFVILLGMLIGVPCSYLITYIVNRITITVTGLLVPSKLPILLCFATLMTVLFVLALFIYFKTAKIKRITPLKAIRSGLEDVFFQSRLTTPITKRGIDFLLALRQLVSGKKRYLGAGIVTILMVFFLSLIGRIGAWIGEDGEGMKNSFSTATCDVGVHVIEDVKLKDVEQEITKFSGIQKSYELMADTASLEGVDYTINIISDPEKYHMLSGRACNYANEIVITKILSKDIGVKIGDTVKVIFQGKTADYIVSGYYQCANDMGQNFGMSKEGFKRLYSGKINPYMCYILKNPSAKQKIINDVKKVFGNKVEIDDNTWSGMDGILTAMDALEVLMYIIVVIFVIIVISMSGSKILYMEQRDLGIYRSLGFTSHRLQLTFAFRFILVAVVGSVIGIAISALCTDSIAKVILSTCGISEFVSNLTFAQMIWPGFVVTVLFFVFALLVARKIRKVEPTILITE